MAEAYACLSMGKSIFRIKNHPLAIKNKPAINLTGNFGLYWNGAVYKIGKQVTFFNERVADYIHG